MDRIKRESKMGDNFYFLDHKPSGDRCEYDVSTIHRAGGLRENTLTYSKYVSDACHLINSNPVSLSRSAISSQTPRGHNAKTIRWFSVRGVAL